MCGLPASWEQSAASVGFPALVRTAVWSPCSKFVAISWGRFDYGGTVEILDAMTLGQLKILPLYKQSITKCLIFSPDTSLLTWIGLDPDWIISWDVQTGVLVSTISSKLLGGFAGEVSVTYSTCGTMIGLHTCNASTSTISIYNILSGTHMHSHSMKKLKLEGVWTHGECLRYAVMKSGIITTWEVRFISTHTLTKVESLSLPPNLPSKEIPIFYPALSLIVFFIHGTGYILDTEHSKYLLVFRDPASHQRPSFSTDGCFFAYITHDSNVNIWRESPTGYTFHRRLTSISSNMLYISPNGESLLTRSILVAQLWHITDSSIPNLTTSTQTSQRNSRSHLVFSPDRTLAAVTPWRGTTVTVLDLKSSVPRLIIDTGMEVYGLGVAGGTIVIIGYDDNSTGKKFVTWNIPARDCALNLKANIDDSVKTITSSDQPKSKSSCASVSVSPDLHHILSVERNYPGISFHGLYLYDSLTGQCLASAPKVTYGDPGFTQDGYGVWAHDTSGEEEGWRIIKDDECNVTKLEYLGLTKCPPGELSWQCSPGYQVRDGWILHSNGKRLLWLPPHWWPDWDDRVWSGQFLGLVTSKLPEVLVLELE